MGEKEMREWCLFHYGIKPVLQLMFMDQYEKNKKQFRGYPTRAFENGVLLFQNEEQKKDFNKIRNEKDFSVRVEKLGLLLGYPPKAAYYFAEGIKEGFDYSLHIGVDYHGFQFTCHIEDVRENLKWMRENYYIPMELKNRIFIWNQKKEKILKEASEEELDLVIEELKKEKKLKM